MREVDGWRHQTSSSLSLVSPVSVSVNIEVHSEKRCFDVKGLLHDRYQQHNSRPFDAEVFESHRSRSV
jgi:hypothetical protein